MTALGADVGGLRGIVALWVSRRGGGGGLGGVMASVGAGVRGVGGIVALWVPGWELGGQHGCCGCRGGGLGGGMAAMGAGVWDLGLLRIIAAKETII